MQTDIQQLGDVVAPMEERTKCIIVQDLVKTYKGGRVKALQGLTLDIYEGEIFV